MTEFNGFRWLRNYTAKQIIYDLETKTMFQGQVTSIKTIIIFLSLIIIIGIVRWHCFLIASQKTVPPNYLLRIYFFVSWLRIISGFVCLLGPTSIKRFRQRFLIAKTADGVKLRSCLTPHFLKSGYPPP